MPLPQLQDAFWTNPLTTGERTITYYFLVIAGAAMFAMFVRTWTSRQEVGSRYRPAIFASLGVTGVAFLSYVVLIVKFDLGYTRSGGSATGAGAMWIPNEDAIWSWAPRFMDWSITVPLLMAEVIALSALVGVVATRARTVAMLAVGGEAGIGSRVGPRSRMHGFRKPPRYARSIAWSSPLRSA